MTAAWTAPADAAGVLAHIADGETELATKLLTDWQLDYVEEVIDCLAALARVQIRTLTRAGGGMLRLEPPDMKAMQAVGAAMARIQKGPELPVHCYSCMVSAVASIAVEAAVQNGLSPHVYAEILRGVPVPPD